MCLCYLHITLGVRPQLHVRQTPPYVRWVQNEASQFANCETFLENCKSELLKKIAKQLFLTIKYFLHSKLLYLLCSLVDQARKEITQISSLIFNRTSKNLVRANTSLVTLSKSFKLLTPPPKQSFINTLAKHQKRAIGFALSGAETRVFAMAIWRSTDTVFCSWVRQTNESII